MIGRQADRHIGNRTTKINLKIILYLERIQLYNINIPTLRGKLDIH